jgi:integrase
VLPHIGAMPIQKLRPAHLIELYAMLQRRGGHKGAKLAPRTVGGVHRVLRRALGHAVTWNVIVSNPAAAVKPPPVPSTEIGIFTEAQIGALLRHLNGRTLRPIVSFLVGTGARRGEALALRWKDVDLDKAVVRIERSLEQTRAGVRVKEPKTRNGRRNITISRWLVAELRAHRLRQDEQRFALGLGRADDEALVFARYDGRPRVPFSITRDFAVALKRLGIGGRTLHSLRHTHVSQLIAAGMDVLTISRRIGHASAAITLGIYGHMIAGQDARAAEITQALFTTIAARR